MMLHSNFPLFLKKDYWIWYCSTVCVKLGQLFETASKRQQLESCHRREPKTVTAQTAEIRKCHVIFKSFKNPASRKKNVWSGIWKFSGLPDWMCCLVNPRNMIITDTKLQLQEEFKPYCDSPHKRPVHVLFSRFYPDLILILSWFSPNFIQIKSG